ncbi:MAG: putative maltokinase, partial [Burkholderiales bacterium]
NPSVLKAVFRVMLFWLDMGVDGFRLDAIPYLIEREGTSNENNPETHSVIKQIRADLDAHYKGKLLLAEANMWPEDVRAYFGDGDECHMCYHFPMMPRLYMSIAMEDRHPLVEILGQTPPIPPNCQWAIFLRNHDELTLEMVTDRERDYMYRIFASDSRMRVNVGIRRRLAPLMENSRQRIELITFLLMTMPGAPILYYGDEIGMGDNIYLGDRNGVRTPMQWSPDRNAGFSRADPQRLYLPPIMDALYGYEAVNVEAQERDSGSQLNWLKRMLAIRKESHAFGRGRLSFLRPGNRKILAYLRELNDEAILCVANLSRSAQPVELDLRKYKGRVPVELLGRTSFPPIGDLRYLLTIPAHGFYWFRLATDAEPPSWHTQMIVPDEAPVLVLFDGWLSFFRDKVVPWRMGMADKLRAQLETEVLPRYVESQRWYASKGQRVETARLLDHAIWDAGGGISWLLLVLEVGEASYFLPVALAWEEEEAHVRALAQSTVARVRQQANVGVAGDAIADESFCRNVARAIGEGRSLPTERGTLRFTPTQAFGEIAGDDIAALGVGQLHMQATNTSVTIGERLFLKCYRRLRAGINPELEVGRFLTEVARFPNCVRVAGAVEYSTGSGDPVTLALLQAYLPNQGDGWSYTLDYLERFLETQLGAPEENHGAYLLLIHTLATRTAELHRAFAIMSGDAVFDPEPLAEADVAAWKASVRKEAEETLALVKSNELIERRQRLLALIDSCAAPRGPALRTRHHGDYHLGQVLVANNDFFIIDFEGEPSRPLEDSRRKHSPLRDVAGMLRSFSYAKWTATRTGSLDAWEQQTRKAFLSAYDAATQGSGLFESFADVQGLLRLFELEKALYELRYEFNNRPDWLQVPLAGIIAMLEEGG